MDVASEKNNSSPARLWAWPSTPTAWPGATISRIIFAADTGVALGPALYRGLYYFERGGVSRMLETSMGGTPMQIGGPGSLVGGYDRCSVLTGHLLEV